METWLNYITPWQKHMILSRLLYMACLAPTFLSVCDAKDPRHVPLSGQCNFRDIGGYKTEDGRTVKQGLIFRSGELPRLTDDDIATLNRLGVKTVVNFLTKVETESRGKDRLPRGAREVSLPIETDDGLAASIEQARRTADFSSMPPSMNPEIHRMLVDDARKQYAALFREIAESREPLVYHCSHGVHRTGTATAVLLWGLGVPWETVREDYLLSNKYREEEVKTRLAELKHRLANKQGVPPEKVDMKNIEAFYIQKGEYIDASRDEILKEYGSIHNYMTRGLGLSETDICTLKEKMLE